ncbi:MAG: hypothetical protein ACI9XK_001481 [Granulosicoccus sp.]|jgi:hypothetical protein
MVQKLKVVTTIIWVLIGICFTMAALASDVDDHSFECAGEYEEQSFSEYVLPYAIGQSYLVGQGNCTDGSHESGSDQAYAYDFDMLVGTPVVASRSGEVLEVEERFIDDNETPCVKIVVLYLRVDSFNQQGACNKEFMNYSPERREAVLKKMLPPDQRSIPD